MSLPAKVLALADLGTSLVRNLEVQPSADTSIVPATPGLFPAQIDKSVLAIAEPKRLRDKAHLRFVASQTCLVCGRQPSDPHHLRFAQRRALGLKVSDEFTVPLCRTHHREIQRYGDEAAWWSKYRLEPLSVASTLWRQTHPLPAKPQWSGSDESAADAQNIAGGKDAGEKTANLGRLPDETNTDEVRNVTAANQGVFERADAPKGGSSRTGFNVKRDANPSVG